MPHSVVGELAASVTLFILILPYSKVTPLIQDQVLNGFRAVYALRSRGTGFRADDRGYRLGGSTKRKQIPQIY